jgi:hypothetical protein
MSLQHRRFRLDRRVALLGLVALLACDSDKAITAPVATQYHLQTINGSALPYQIDQSSDGTVTYVITDMVLSVDDYGSWVSSGHRTVTTNGVPAVQPIQDGGVYSGNGSSVTFANFNGGLIWTGTLSANTYNLMDLSTNTYVFVKQ